MKRRIMTALVIIGIGGLLIIIGLIMGGRIKKVFFDSEEEWTMNDEHTGIALSADARDLQFAADGSVLKHLDADISYSTLRIEPHDKQFVAYSITDNTKRIGASVQVEGNTLRIGTKKPRKWDWLFGWQHDRVGRSKTVITVKIPQNMLFDTAKLNIGAASLVLDGFTVNQKFSLNIGAGEVMVTNMTASDVHIKTGVGESTFRNCTFTDTTLNTGVGETSFEGKILKNLDINAGIGEIDMRIHGRKDDYLIDATTGIGSILIDGRSAAGLGSTYRVSNQNALNTMSIKAGIGEVRIYFIE